MTGAEDSKADLRATEKVVALKVSEKVTDRKEEEKVAVSRGRVLLNAAMWVARRRSAWCTWLGRWGLKARSRSAK